MSNISLKTLIIGLGLSLSIPLSYATAALPKDVVKLDNARAQMISVLLRRELPGREPDNQVNLEKALKKVEQRWWQYRQAICAYEMTKTPDLKAEHACLLRVTRLHNEYFQRAIK